MTTVTDTSINQPVRVLSARTLRTYAGDWALFTDWCAATDTTALPAAPQTVVGFLTGCPAAPATQRCRVAAIDHHRTRPAGGVGGGAGRARPAHRRTLPPHRWERTGMRWRRRCAGCPPTAGPKGNRSVSARCTFPRTAARHGIDWGHRSSFRRPLRSEADIPRHRLAPAVIRQSSLACSGGLSGPGLSALMSCSALAVGCAGRLYSRPSSGGCTATSGGAPTSPGRHERKGVLQMRVGIIAAACATAALLLASAPAAHAADFGDCPGVSGGNGRYMLKADASCDLSLLGDDAHVDLAGYTLSTISTTSGPSSVIHAVHVVLSGGSLR